MSRAIRTNEIGPRGSAGPQGPQGQPGSRGDVGQSGQPGESAGMKYVFSPATIDIDPGMGVFRYNSTTIGSVTQIFIDNSDVSNVDLSNYIDSWDDTTSAVRGYILVNSNNINSNTFNIWALSENVVDGTGYRKLTVTYVSGALPSNGENCVITFSKIADQGPQGIQGIQGERGLQGNQGIQGIQGLTGSVPLTISSSPPISGGSEGDVWYVV